MPSSVCHQPEISHFSNPMKAKMSKIKYPIEGLLVFPKSDKLKIRDFLIVGNILSISVCC